MASEICMRVPAILARRLRSEPTMESGARSGRMTHALQDSLCRPPIAEVARLHGHGRARARAGDRGQRGAVQRGELGLPAAVTVRGARSAGAPELHAPGAEP